MSKNEIDKLLSENKEAIKQGQDQHNNRKRRRRGRGNPWKKGESGNPNGRPVYSVDEKGRPTKNGKPMKSEEAIKMARKMMPAAFEKLGYIIQNTDNDMAAIAAFKELANRAYGKASQNISVSGEITHTHKQELENIWQQIKSDEAEQRQIEDAREAEFTVVEEPKEEETHKNFPTMDQRDPKMFAIRKIIEGKLEKK